MALQLGRFELPKRIIKNERESTDTYGVFIAEPLEAGYGFTLGHTLRRVLVSSSEGAAITAVKIKGATDEYTQLPGILESVTDLILNCKGVLLKLHGAETVRVSLHAEGPGEVTAGDIQTDEHVEILNPDYHIATLEENGRLEMELDIRNGRGYGSAAAIYSEGLEAGFIAIDALFSPVRRVKFNVENTRVGRRTDFDKLVLEIWTDGRLVPDDAMTRSAHIIVEQLGAFLTSETEIEFPPDIPTEDEDSAEMSRLLAMSVNEIELSVRAANCLNNANIVTVGELAQKTEAEMLKYRNFGKKSLNEIKAKLVEMGLSLGMQFDDKMLRPPKLKL
jgi:DNA-directed RNA polymerase subunit alpha